MAHEQLFADGVRMQGGRFIVPQRTRVQESGRTVERVQESMVSTSDTKQFFTNGLQMFFMNDPEIMDVGWQELFSVVGSTSHGELFPFRAPDAAGQGVHGIVFEAVGELGEIKYNKVTSDEKYVKNVKYAGALGYSNEWFSDGSLGMIEMATRDFRQSASDRMAAIHYAAIVAAATSGVSLSAAMGGTEVNDWVNALDAANVIMRRNRRLPSVVLGPPEVENFLGVAQFGHYGFQNIGGTQSNSLNENATGGRAPVAGRFKVITTDHLAAGATTSSVYVIEPKRRLISTDREQLSLGNFQDLLHDAETLVGKFRRGVLVGEGQVIRRITAVPHALPVA
jgi:hypothetical protein